MADRQVTGKMQILFVDPAGGTDYQPVVCLTSDGIKRSTTTNDSSSFCGSSSTPGAQQVTIDFAGQVMIIDEAGSPPNISEGGLHDIWQNSDTIGWKIGPAAPVLGDDVYSGTGYIATLDRTNDLTGATFSGTIAPYGNITRVSFGES